MIDEKSGTSNIVVSTDEYTVVSEYIPEERKSSKWILERYAIITDKASGIVNDPNEWTAKQENPRYTLDLLLE